MKYNYEFKKECVQLYREGKWADTPERIKEKNFHDSIRKWFKLEELHGPEILKHENNIKWTAEEKYEEFSRAIGKYIYYYNNERIQSKTKWMPPTKYRLASTTTT